MLIERTTALCHYCDCSHEANLFVQDKRVMAVVHCPKGDIEYSISSDANMFLKMRHKSFNRTDGDEPQKLRYVLNYIPITDACNFKCTICGADAKFNQEERSFLALEDIYQRALKVKQDGGYMVNLTGGEPTLHPELLLVVKRISSTGISLGINTNGYLLGKDKTLAYNLKQNGLNRVVIQFDSFNEDVLSQLGRNYLKEKREAINNAIDAGLRVGLNSIVTRKNFPELAKLLKHGLDLGSSVLNIAFATPAHIGRYPISNTDNVDREQMMSQLLEIGDDYHFSIDDFSPLPTFLPWGIQVHPDCGIHIIFVRTPDSIRPLNYYVDIKKLYRSLSFLPNEQSVMKKYILPIIYLLGSVRKRKRIENLRITLGLLFAKKTYSVVNVGLSNYTAAEFLDEKRIKSCSAAFYTDKGPVPGCIFAFLGKQYFDPESYDESIRTFL